MLFLADESCDFAVVRALRSAGHDVTSVAEIAPGADDGTVLTIAKDQKRLLLTEDKDFGQLVYADQRETGGVLLIRWPFSARASLPTRIVQLVADRADDLPGRFVVVTPGQIRLASRPNP